MPVMLNTHTLDIVFGFDDTMYHLSPKNYNLKAIKTNGNCNSRICLVSKNELPKDYTLLSEYENAQNKNSIFKNLPGNPTVTVCTGKAENFVVDNIYDACVCIVESGETLEKLGLEIQKEMYKVTFGAWVNVSTDIGYKLYTLYQQNHKHIYLEGIDGSGKTTLYNQLVQDSDYRHFIIKDRSPLTKLTLVDQEFWPIHIKTQEKDEYWILDTLPEICEQRLQKREHRDPWENINIQCYFYKIYLSLGYHYGCYLITQDSTTTFTKTKLPQMSTFTQQVFDTLPEITRGESKIIKNYNNTFEIIQLIPSIYSHKQKRAGIVDGSDILRMKMSRDCLSILSKHSTLYNVHHWQYIGEKFIVAKKLIGETPLEVVIKTQFVGTDKHRYPGLVPDNSLYPKPYVRFDYRNENSHPEGDVCIARPLLENLKIIDTKTSERIALQTFKWLEQHFLTINIRLVDMCFFMTKDGKKIYSEISQDNARYKLYDNGCIQDLDKDVWRSGGSSELILEKYTQLQKITHTIVEKNREEINNLFK
jgi:phosphoribosylaminoimidazole-succinocarboxamide synthase